MMGYSNHQSQQSTIHRRRLRAVITSLVALGFALFVVGCDDERKSQKQEEKSPESEYEQASNTPRKTGKAGKTEKSMRMIYNYLLKSKSRRGLPDDLEGAKDALSWDNIEWIDDQWGNELIYEKIDDKTFAIRSAGPDGEPKTDDDLVVDE